MLKSNQLKLTCLLLALLTVSLLVRFVSTQVLNSNDIIVHRDHSDHAIINPNTADWPSLARLPGIGETKAKAIIRHRNEVHKSSASNKPVFKSASDLKAVKGIGEKTIQNIGLYLIFDEEK